MNPRWGRAPAVLAALALAATACSGGGGAVDVGPEGGGDGAAGGTATVADGGGGEVLVAALGGDPDQLDPHTTTSSFAFKVLENVYDTLVQPGADLTMEPALAESWETSDDLLTWTFQLRQGVTFHDDSDFDAGDVKASYDRIIEEGQNAFRFASVDEVEVVDDVTVALHLSRPTPNLLVNIGSFKGMAIAPSEAIDAGTLGDEPVGTGPFELVEFVPGDHVTLTRNDGYWGGPDRPYLGGVEFRIIPEESVKLTNLETGEVDWIDTVPPQQVSQLEDSDDVVVGRVTGNDYWYLATNIAREPYDDVDVRRAMSFALDREAITEAARFDTATVNQTAIPPSSFWHYDYAPFVRDVEMAQQLLDQAGVDGLSMDLMVTNEFPETVAAAQVVASQLAEVGITAEIRTEDFSTWLAEQGDGNFDAFILGWLGNIDPDDYYYAQHHCDGVNNFQGYCNEEVDRLLDAGREETDQDARKERYDQAAQIIVDDASYLYFYNPDIINAWAPYVTGYETRADNAVRFVDTRIER